MRYTVKVYEGCPVPTVLWNIVSLLGCVSGVSGPLCIYYVFFPTKNTNHAFVLAGAVICVPLFIICLLLRKPIDKFGEKQLKEKGKRAEAVRLTGNGVKAHAFQNRGNIQRSQFIHFFMTLGILMLVFLCCIFYACMQ